MIWLRNWLFTHYYVVLHKCAVLSSILQYDLGWCRRLCILLKCIHLRLTSIYEVSQINVSIMFILKYLINPFHSRYTLANSEDQGEMPHKAAFLQGLHCLLRYPSLGTEMHHFIENSTCGPLKYEMDNHILL